jgi:hypothetical protein
MFDRLGSLRLADASRAEFDDGLAEGDLAQLAGMSTLETLQCSSPVRDSIWSQLNTQFFALRPDVQLRVYGHYGIECDLAFAGRMTNVRRFAADCLVRARNVEAIADMPRLDALSLDILELEEFGVLNRVSSALTSLSLGTTRSKKPRLAPLDRFRSLRVLYLEGQSNGIEVLGGLEQLEDVTLRSITTPDLRYLAPLNRLWSLDIKLGGIRSFEGIEGKATIKYLELWQLRKLRDATVLHSLPGLQNVFMQSLPHIQSLPPLGASGALRRMVLENLKGLDDFASLEGVPALEEFALLDGSRQQPEQLVPVLRNPALRRIRAGFGSDRKNQTFARLRDAHGKSNWDPGTPFEYR